MVFLILKMILLQTPFISGPQTVGRLAPFSNGRIWVRGKPLPNTQMSPAFLALKLKEHELFPPQSYSVKKLTNNKTKLPKSLSWLKGMNYPDIPISFNKSVIKYLNWFRSSRSGRAVIKGWIQNSGQYRKMILEVLHRNKLPSAILYIAMIESGYVKTTKSWAGALGLWQFMPSNSKTYGLLKTQWIDQRMDPELSTEAAMFYFTDLFFRFKNWHLALGAYNCGYGRMLRSMRRYNKNDFWLLKASENALPRETRLYIPKLIAVAIVDLNRDRFNLGKIKMKKPYSFEYVYYPGGYPLKSVASQAALPFKTIWNLNREYLKKRTPPGKKRWPVRVPIGYKIKLIKKLKTISPSWFKYKVYTVQLGDTLKIISKQYGTSSYRLRKLNKIGSSTDFKVGLNILLPRKIPRPLSMESPREKPVVSMPAVVKIPPGTKRWLYKITPGDSLDIIATNVGVKLDKLLKWNLLTPLAGITHNMYIQIFLPLKRKPHKSLINENKIVLIKVDSIVFIQHYLNKLKRVRLVHKVKKGETLKKLSKKYGSSRRFIRSLNNRNNSKLKKGELLIIYALKSKLSKKRVNKLFKNPKKIKNKSKISIQKKPRTTPSNMLNKKPLTKNNGLKKQKVITKKQEPKLNAKNGKPSGTAKNIENKLTTQFKGDVAGDNGIAWTGISRKHRAKSVKPKNSK
jgi:peptidoglycan lytic transglycosylase D